MTLENVQKKYKYVCKLAKGEFNERDFDKTYGKTDDFEGGSEEGITLQGKMTPQRVDLIKSNALRNKLDIEKKLEHIKKFQKVKEPVKEIKSKEEE